MSEQDRDAAMRRFAVLRPHLEDDVPLARSAHAAGVAERTARRWLAAYRAGGLGALARGVRADEGSRRMPEELRLLIEGLALRRPAPSAAGVHRQAMAVAAQRGWPPPSYRTVCKIVAGLDPGLLCLGREGARRYGERFELVGRRQAERPNELWQADHTELDLWVLDEAGTPARPWLTVILDDHSRAVASYAVTLAAPSAINTALALRRAIWRKPEPGWQVCGIPAAFYTDHGSDFTSRHMEQVAADLKIRLIFSLPGQPRGRGKIERFFGTVNQLLLSSLPGYAPPGLAARPEQARLRLAELDTALAGWIVRDYHTRRHSETHQTPTDRWAAGGFLPRMPDSLEQLDLLLLTVAKPRKIHPDGIRFAGLRYLDTTLAAYVGEHAVVRYDPRDLAEIRVFLHGEFLCRAICPDLAGATISFRELIAARRRHRRDLTRTLADRTALVDQLLELRAAPTRTSDATDQPSPPAHRTAPVLKTYAEE